MKTLHHNASEDFLHKIQNEFSRFFAYDRLSEEQKNRLPTTNFYRNRLGLPLIEVPSTDEHYQNYFNPQNVDELELTINDYGYPAMWDNEEPPLQKRPIILPEFSFFKAPITNTIPYQNITLPDLYKVIQGTYFKNQTKQLRATSDNRKAKSLKAKSFHYVTLSGTFSKRGNNYLLRHSNYICLDFDRLKNLSESKEYLLNDPHIETELLFCSPSGNGLKWVVSIDIDSGNHLDYFHAINKYVQSNYGLIPDKACKEVSRACFVPHDSEVFIHPKYTLPC